MLKLSVEDQENELICEKLLGWSKIFDAEGSVQRPVAGWQHGTQECCLRTPSFTTWADAGRILEALQAIPTVSISIENGISRRWWCTIGSSLNAQKKGAPTAPRAIRAAALAYIKNSNCVHDLDRADKTLRMHEADGLVGWRCNVCGDVWMLTRTP